VSQLLSYPVADARRHEDAPPATLQLHRRQRPTLPIGEHERLRLKPTDYDASQAGPRPRVSRTRLTYFTEGGASAV